MIKQAISFLVIILMMACAGNPYKASNKTYKNQTKTLSKLIKQAPLQDSFITSANWIGTTNLNLRKPNFVVIHYTAQNSCDQTLKTFTITNTQVSAHYVICKDGTIHHMLNDYLRAWHAGSGKWGNNTDLNSNSIGIELDNNGFELFPDVQLNSLLLVLDKLKKAFNIPAANFIGHEDLAPARKIDPGTLFPWKQLGENGFGIWYDDTTAVTVPADFNTLNALRIIGYDTNDSSAAIKTFKRHWLQQDSSVTINDNEKKVLYNVMKKSM
jgi:N-acetylmuramoyl-L-alanine amidase